MNERPIGASRLLQNTAAFNTSMGLELSHFESSHGMPSFGEMTLFDGALFPILGKWHSATQSIVSSLS